MNLPPAPSRTLLALLLTTVTLHSIPAVARAQEPGWGSLKARFVLSGPLPESQPLQIERDAEVCGTVGLVDESLTVNPKNRGIRNLIVWLEAKTPVPVHPRRQQPLQPAMLDNRGCRFEPRVL
ncbi:MAG: hypothetical protein ACKPJJ_19530, partial [Planctomycetaceae bacterium]